MTRRVEAEILFTSEGLDITKVSGRPRTLGNVGLALSGGGSRAASVSMGAVRALWHLGLMQHVRAISCVSGGSWFSVPFTFLPEQFDEREFLGPLVTDPRALQVERELAAGNFGAPLTSFDMSVLNIVSDALQDRDAGVPTHRLWARQVGRQLLARFGLSRFEGTLPADTFAALRSLKFASAGLPEPFVPREAEAPRPWLILGGCMRVRDDDGHDTLAPVQFTPRFSGVFGRGIGTLGGREVGGGAISSYAFGGRWVGGPTRKPQVELDAPFALSDATGISSAAFADALGDRDIHSLSPTYRYFSPTWRPDAGVEAVFGDGGSVENTGVANLLAYEDIEGVIAVVSSPKPIEIFEDQVIVERQIGALFGYREYDLLEGYVPYSEAGGGNPDYAHNQVFSDAKGEFAKLVAAMGKLHQAGEPIVVTQTLETVDNLRFAVRGGRKVRVVWSFLSPARRWEEQLCDDIVIALPLSFPNLPTRKTSMRACDVALLAHFSAWMLVESSEQLRKLFSP